MKSKLKPYLLVTPCYVVLLEYKSGHFSLNAQLFFVFTAKTNSIAFGSSIRTVVSVQPFVRIGCKLGLYG